MSQKLNGGGQERVSQVLDGHFHICKLGPKSASVSPKTALQPAKNSQMKGNSSYSTHAVRLPRVKRPPTAPHQKQTISWATWLQTRIRAHLIHLQPPTCAGFHASKLPQPTPRPPYQGLVGYGKLQWVAQRGGCQHGSTRSTGCKKKGLFSKIILDHMECKTSVVGAF